MLWVIAATAALVGLVVVVVTVLVETVPVAPLPDASAPLEVTPRELREARPPLAWRGYDPGTVDALLARAAATLEAAGSGQELEDRGGDGPGRLDRGPVADVGEHLDAADGD